MDEDLSAKLEEGVDEEAHVALCLACMGDEAGGLEHLIEQLPRGGADAAADALVLGDVLYLDLDGNSSKIRSSLHTVSVALYMEMRTITS